MMSLEQESVSGTRDVVESSAKNPLSLDLIEKLNGMNFDNLCRALEEMLKKNKRLVIDGWTENLTDAADVLVFARKADYAIDGEFKILEQVPLYLRIVDALTLGHFPK